MFKVTVISAFDLNLQANMFLIYIDLCAEEFFRFACKAKEPKRKLHRLAITLALFVANVSIELKFQCFYVSLSNEISLRNSSFYENVAQRSAREHFVNYVQHKTSFLFAKQHCLDSTLSALINEKRMLQTFDIKDKPALIIYIVSSIWWILNLCKLISIILRNILLGSQAPKKCYQIICNLQLLAK